MTDTATTDTESEQEPPGGPETNGALAFPDGDTVGGSWLLIALLGAIALIVVAFFAFIALTIALSDDSDAGAGGGGGGATSIDVTLREFAIEGDLTAPAGGLTLLVSNVGAVEHNLVVRDTDFRTPDIGAGGSTELDLSALNPGTYEVFCDIPGHEAAGMVSTLTITPDGSAAPAATEAAGEAGGEPAYEAMDRAMTESILAFPAETEGKGNPILEPTEVLSDGTKVFDLTAEIVDWEVEPGRFVEAWTYNGVVPAPQILLDRGDKIQVRVTNNLPMGTDIHWHGVRTPNDQDGVAPITQDLIPPNGGTFTYEFEAVEDAIGMYHAHNHAQIQVINGMFGVMRIGDNPVPRGMTISGVEIPEDLELTMDIPMILNDAGTIGYSLNGKSFPATEPLVLNQGEWVSVTYYNEGLQIHPMHLHQFPQLVYAKDGVPLDEPYWVDTLNVSPGERYTVLFRGDDPGTWVWHCHILTHVEREEGMFGMVTAIVVGEDATFDPDDNPVEPTNFRLTPETADATADHEHLQAAVSAGSDSADQ
jgi:FtsP/CotA-like multicopper oxidase with cupredoxin domain